MESLTDKLKKAKDASFILKQKSHDLRNKALSQIALSLQEKRDIILEANNLDIEKAQSKNISQAIIDRLRLTNDRIDLIITSIQTIITSPDPLNNILEQYTRPNGLLIQKITVPLGVIGVIYEARPNVTVDIACLAIKSGNVCVLRGGSDAYITNTCLVNIMQTAIKEFLPVDCVSFIDSIDRSITLELLKAKKYIDVIIPRGGKGLIDYVISNAIVPVIETGAGNCHLYIHKSSSFDMAETILINGKISRPSVCNSLETLLIDHHVAQEFLPKLKQSLEAHKVEIRGCPKTIKIISVNQATEEDYYQEYNDYIIAIKIVENFDEAIEHIEKYGSHHSDAIVTEDAQIANKFLEQVDSACVYVNASTRFSDGGEFGFGSEIGISTQKLHARGPMGLKEITTYKYIIYGKGQVR